MLIKTLLFAALSLTLSGVEAETFGRQSLHDRGVKVEFYRPVADSSRKESPEIPTIENTITLNELSSKNNQRSAAYVLGKTPAANSTSTLSSIASGGAYGIDIIIGNQTFVVACDTGSAATWVIRDDFQCVDYYGDKVPNAECGFGPSYHNSSTFTQLPNEVFSISYESGETLVGIIATEEVTLGSIDIASQTVGIVTEAYWGGDDRTSGLVGFAYAELTTAYNTTDPDYFPSIEHSPIIQTMIDNDLLTSPLFSFVLLRGTSGDAGYLTLGGVPPLPFTPEFTSTPIIVTNYFGLSNSTFSFYTINIDGISLGGAPISGTGGSNKQFIVDCGTTINYIPKQAADAINDAFIPPAKYDRRYGVHTIPCNATAPDVTFDIGGTKFTISPLDLVRYAGDEVGICYSGVADGGSSDDDIYVLGGVFMRSVITVFDVGAAQIRFAPYVDHASDAAFKQEMESWGA